MTDVEMLVYDGIRKTINRFREKPFFYFTESDIHASLQRDIMEGGSKELVHREDGIAVSLVHLEYPTNFRYKKTDFLRDMVMISRLHRSIMKLNTVIEAISISLY